MNVKTFVKTAPKTAQLTRSLKSPSYQTLASTKDLRQMACKNSPRKSVYCGYMSKLFTHSDWSRVQACSGSHGDMLAQTSPRTADASHPMTTETPQGDR